MLMTMTMTMTMMAASVLLAAPVAPPAPVTFPAYETVRNIDDYATAEEYRKAVADPRFRMDRITYDSNGLQVHAYVYRPRATTQKLPVIVFNRGSYVWEDFSGELATMANRLAASGYLVVAPMYRGSGGAKGRDEMGGAELDDLFNLLPVIAAMPEADMGRLYLYGESRGGMMVYQALRDGFPARAAAVVGAFTDLDTMLRDPRWAEAGKMIWPDLETRRSAIVARRSAVQWPDRINTPVLIIHGADDQQVSVEQSLRLAGKLSELKKPYQLSVIAAQGHTISGRAADRDSWVLDWFSRH